MKQHIIYCTVPKNYNNGSLKVLLGVDEQFNEAGKDIFIDKIVQAQKNIASSDINIEFTSMLGLPKADNTHLTPQGIIVQGIRLFNDFINIGIQVSTPDYYKMVVKHSQSNNQAIEVNGFSIENGANIGQWENYNIDNQLWQVKDGGGGYFWLEPKHIEGKCMEIEGNSTQNYGNVQLGSFNGNDNQLWYVVPVANYYRIINKNSGLSLDINDGNIENGANLYQNEYMDNDNQKFKLLGVNDNSKDPLSKFIKK